MTTKIEWTDETWNPVTGCTKISAGCKNCYADRMAKRLRGRCGYPDDDPFRVTLHPERLTQPLRWRKPRKVFPCSMGDLFHDAVPFEFIAAVFGVIATCPSNTFQILTKRADRMLEFCAWAESLPSASGLSWRDGAPVVGYLGEFALRATSGAANVFSSRFPPWPLPNVWLGVSVENDQNMWRVPLLLQCPAAVRFVSVEPMLGPVDLSPALHVGSCLEPGEPGYGARLDWVICGGESGPGARPMHPDWPRGLRDQCAAAGVPFFFKQMTKKAPIPADLMIREFPEQIPRSHAFNGDTIGLSFEPGSTAVPAE